MKQEEWQHHCFQLLGQFCSVRCWNKNLPKKQEQPCQIRLWTFRFPCPSPKKCRCHKMDRPSHMYFRDRNKIVWVDKTYSSRQYKLLLAFFESDTNWQGVWAHVKFKNRTCENYMSWEFTFIAWCRIFAQLPTKLHVNLGQATKPTVYTLWFFEFIHRSVRQILKQKSTDTVKM